MPRCYWYNSPRMYHIKSVVQGEQRILYDLKEGRYMRGKDRIERIMDILQDEKSATVTDLSERFGVTEETIRRDLNKLSEEGRVTRTYGGAVLTKAPAVESNHFYKRMASYADEKRAIALKVLPLLENKRSVAADSSTTVLEVLKLLKDRQDLTVLTNSTEALCELVDSKMTIMSTGGIFNAQTMSLQGIVATQTINNYTFDTLLMSCAGLDKERGALDSNEFESITKLAMLEQAEQVVMLLDHSKFDKPAFLRLADFTHIDVLVTDQRPSDEWMRFFEENDITIIY